MQTSRGIKILLVDDEPNILEFLEMGLLNEGYRVRTALDGMTAVTIADQFEPHIVVLDVMMPDMDGYQVTATLRQMPATALTPILMFTAKSQVDDKVAGYDAGVDDYLTNPVHPAELVAHIKALLGRSRARNSAAAAQAPVQKSHMVGVVACRGGLGVSSCVLNLATTYAQAYKTPVYAVELRPGQGTWALELGFNNQEGLSNLLQKQVSEITPSVVESSFVATSYGIKLLLAPSDVANLDFGGMAAKLVAIVKALSNVQGIVLLDIGTNFIPGFENICQNLQEMILLTEPQLITVRRTKNFIQNLNKANLMAGKSIDLVIYNRIRADVQMSSMQVTEELDGMPVSLLIPPAPEMANQATQRHMPLINLQPESLVSQQFARLADIIHDHVNS
ncbi:Sensor histidine kinase RcsC [bioreactor metagenome]|uniref:Sensor histidine kinase RcsC n=1 Tax=bioreactor metagenome TaxID=1076179 RepID=A0A644Y0D4_9ZZZZ